MNQQQQLILTFTEISNIKLLPNGGFTVKENAQLIDKQFDPRQDVSVYDRKSLEEQIISISSFDSGTHLLKSGDKYFYAVAFKTVIR